MVFCGKCGFQLTSGYRTCPRCGTPIEPDLILEESQPDNPTIASSPIFGANQPYPGTPVEQQPLFLGSIQNDYGTVEQRANEATSMMGSQIVGADQVPARSAYPGYLPQSAANYPQQGASYPGSTIQGSSTYQQFGVSLENDEKVRARGRIVGLLLILIGLLFILGAMVLFILTHNSSISASSSIQQVNAAFASLCPPICCS
jgi:hypothetical protein